VAVTAVLWLAAFAATPLPDGVRDTAIELLWIPLALLAGAVALVAARIPGERAKTALTLLGLGALAWAVGQTLWALNRIVDVDRYPTEMDVPFAIAFVLMAAAVAAWPRRGGRWRRGDALDFVLVLGVGFLFSYEFVLGAVLDGEEDHVARLGLVLYPIGDLVLGATIVAGLFIGRFEQRARIAVLGAGMGALVVADTFFAVSIDTYDAGSVYAGGWTLAFVAIAAAAVVPAGIDAQLRIPAVTAPGRMVALLVVMGAFLLTERDRDLPGEKIVDTAVAGAIFGLLALRYIGLLLERLRETRELEQLTAQVAREAALRTATLEVSRTGVCVLDAHGAPAFANSAWHAVGAAAFPTLAERLTGGVDRARLEVDGRVLAFSAARLETGETVVSVDDVTDEEREREARDRFIAEVVRARDLEARRIAELLHDDAVQQLTALSMRLDLAALQREDARLAELAREAARINESLRRLLVDLHPAVLESQGLGAGVETAAAGLRVLGVDVRVDRFDHRLAPEVEQLAYRLVQEALANVLKHAGASRVDVALRIDGGVLRCSVDDDGVGALDDDVEGALRRGSLGLHLVRERVELADGRFEIGRRHAGGTRFAFELPLAGVAAHAPEEVPA
jgi:signal transduction histidine kinase